MAEELGAISVGLRVGLGSLDRDLANIQKKIDPIEREHTIPFKVGRINTDEIQREIQKITRGQVKIPVNVTLPANAGRVLHRELTAQLKAAGPVPVQIKANLTRTEITRIKREIEREMKRVGHPIHVPITTVGSGGGTPPTTGGPTPAVPPSRPPRQPTAARSAPVPPSRASAPTAAPVEAPAAAPAARPTPAAPVAPTRQPRPRQQPKAATKPDYSVTADFGQGLPTGPASQLAFRTTPGGQQEVIPGGGLTGTAGYLAKKSAARQGRTVSTDTLRREKTRPRTPETPEEIEYAARPTQVSYHGPQEEMEFQQEKAGRGVRGASRSGARQRNEPVLTPLDMLAIENQQGINEAENVALRTGEIRKPARRSSAYYGSPGQSRVFRQMVSKLQFYKFDPVLAEAFEALSGGELGEARALLTGFSQKLAGVDPRQRKKFFRLFRNVENVPPELLERHSALQSLFSEISIQQAQLRLDNSQRALDSFARPKGPQAGWEEPVLTAYKDLLGARQQAQRFFSDTLRGLRPRATGGRVFGERGSLPVFGRGLKGIKPSDFGEMGDIFTSLMGMQYQLRRVPISSIRPAHGTVDERVSEYGQMGGEAPPIILGPRGIVQDGHHRLEMARRAGAEDILAYVFAGKESDLPPELLAKFGIKGRAGGGMVEGPLARRLREAREKKYLVGETRPEAFVGDSGRAEIVGEHGPEVRTFPESGKVLPYVPEWVRRGMPKDLTGRQGGGPIYGGRLAAEPGSGLRGRKQFREEFFGERAAIAVGQLSPQGGVERVFVVNWPANFSGGGFVSNPAGAGRAAGPFRFANDKDAQKFADQLGGSIGRQLKGLLPGTEELTEPKEPQAETATRQKLSPLEQLESRLGATATASELRERQLAIRSGVSEIQQQIPVRSLAPAFGQITATVFGGRGEALARLNKARDLTDQASKAAGIYVTQLQKLSDLEERRKKGEEGLEEPIKEQSEATKRAGDNARKLTEDAEGATKAADSLGLKLRVLAANTVGIIGGTLAFGATLGIAQAGLAAAEQVLTPVIDRLTGFKGITTEITRELGNQTRAQQGAVQTTVAQREAQAGLSQAVAETISPLLQQRAITEGGNAAFLDQLNLLRTARNIQQEERFGALGLPTGPFQPPGGIPGVTRATGGFLGTPIGATPSLFEQIAGEANEQPIQQFLRNVLGPQTSQGLGLGPVLSGEEVAKVVQEELDKQARGQGFDLGRVAGAAAPGLQVSDSIKAMAEGLDKLDSDFKILTSSNSTLSESTQRQANLQLAFNGGVAPELIAAFDKLGGIAVVRRDTGEIATSREDFKQAFSDVLKSFTIPDVSVLIKQLTERQIPAQRAQFAAEGRLQRNIIAPAQFALQELAAPTPGVGQIPFERGLVGEGDVEAKKVAAAYKTQIGGAVSFVNQQIDNGREQLVNLVPQNLRTEFGALLTDIENTGRQISDIQLAVQQKQVNLEVDEYNNQIRIARRSLQDALDLQAGIKGETRETLGGIEGQNIALQRQLQLLQFELQQRQINFRLATAGFVAPGTTPEERAARIEAAKKEAEFAQKQLDIQKQLSANQFRGVQISADRNVTDLLAQIDLLQRGRGLTIDTANASRALDILNKKQSLLVQQAGAYIQEGVQITQAAIQAAAVIQAQTGKGFSYILGQTATAWGIFGQQARMILNALTGTAPSGGGGGGGSAPKLLASGIVGDTLGPTEITVGEAAGEKVAVLKNPKLVPSSTLAAMGSGSMGGGGSFHLTVVVTGNQIKDEQAVDRLVEKVVDEAERRLMQKTGLFGLRRF